jgi:hypothetical protein
MSLWAGRHFFEIIHLWTQRSKPIAIPINQAMTGSQQELPVSSSTPPTLTPEQEACYRDVLLALNRAQIPYAVGGAFALHEHCGIWRDTKDLDLMLEPSSVPEALKQLAAIGYTTTIEDPVWLAKAYRGNYYVDFITGLGNAVLVADRSWMENAIPYNLFGVPSHVIGAEELIACKIFVTRRERFDGADVVHLLRARATTINWERLETLMSSHWELLLWSLVLFAYIYPSRKSSVPPRVWERLLDRFRSGLRDSQGPFRGTLIDPLMFAIDVNEWGEHDTFEELCLKHSQLLRVASPAEEEPE